MKRRLRGVLIGMLLGAALAGAGAWWALGPTATEGDWVNYPTLGDAVHGSQRQEEWARREFRGYLYLGVLLGGGFGAVAGAIVENTEKRP